MESSLWKLIKNKYSKFGHIIRVENPILPGTPDVNYCFDGLEGWIELKAIPHWPRRPKTLVRIDHYTLEQRLWARERSWAGGRVFMLLRVDEEREYLLIHGAVAADNIGITNRQELTDLALVWGKGTFPSTPVLKALTAV
jgi:hypothetical protein